MRAGSWFSLSAVAALLVLTSITAACDTSTAPTITPPYSQVDLTLGTGTAATTGMFITVNYTGWLYDVTKTDQKGLQFETSIGSTPFALTLGSGQVIAGWDRGIPGMMVGGTRRLVIPPSLAYGGTRNGVIPPNAALVFDIQLLSAQ